MESGKGRVAAGVDDGEAEVGGSWSRFAEGGGGFVDVVSQAVGGRSVFGRSGFGVLWVMGCDYREGAVDIVCKRGGNMWLGLMIFGGFLRQGCGFGFMTHGSYDVYLAR